VESEARLAGSFCHPVLYVSGRIEVKFQQLSQAAAFIGSVRTRFLALSKSEHLRIAILRSEIPKPIEAQIASGTVVRRDQRPARCDMTDVTRRSILTSLSKTESLILAIHTVLAQRKFVPNLACCGGLGGY